MKTKIVLCFIVLLLSSVASADALTVYAIHNNGELNIRAKPNRHAEQIGYLFPGDAVEYQGINGEWVYVVTGIENGGGWVCADYLSIWPNAAGLYVNESGGRLRVRAVPNGKVVGWIGSGNTVEVSGILPDDSGTHWGKTEGGYVLLSWLRKVEDTEGIPLGGKR